MVVKQQVIPIFHDVKFVPPKTQESLTNIEVELQ